jgi:hypothetical protein
MMSADPRDRPSMAEAATQLSALAIGGDTARQPAAGLDSARSATPDQTRPMPGPELASDPLSAPTPRLPRAAVPDTPAATPVAAPVAAPEWRVPEPVTAVRRPAPAPTTRRRRGLVAAIVVLVVLLATVAVALLLTDREQPTVPSGSASTAPATARSGDATVEPTEAELTQAVSDYYALLPDDTDAAWERLTTSYQRQTGGLDSYQGFWNDIDSVTVSELSATLPDRVQATVSYVEKSGNRRSTERRSFRLVRAGEVLKIDQSSVI